MAPSFHQLYMALAVALSKRSHCVKKEVGAVITKEDRVIATGYNGPPSGSPHCDEHWPIQGCKRSLTGGCSLALHAEENAILFALRHKIDLVGSRLYITLSPCLPCARTIFSVGITHVLYQDTYAAFKGNKEEEGLLFLESLGVEVAQYKAEKADKH